MSFKEKLTPREKLFDSVITFASSLITIYFFSSLIQRVARFIAKTLSITEITTIQLYITALFIAAVTFLISMMLQWLSRGVRIDVKFQHRNGRSVSELKFDKIKDSTDFVPKYIKLCFTIHSHPLAFKLTKHLGGRIRIVFNPRLINCELENDILHQDDNHSPNYITFNIFPLCEANAYGILIPLELNLQPLHEFNNGTISAHIVTKKPKSELSPIYIIKNIFLKIIVRMNIEKITLNPK